MAKTKKKFPKIGKRVVKSEFEFTEYSNAKKSLPRGWRIEYEVDKLAYVLKKNYIPDLTITRKDGTILYIELKGLGRAFAPEVRAKMIEVKKQHSDKDIRIVFYRDGRLDKRTQMTASKWAEKYGFQYAVGTIPEDWLEE